MRDGDLVVTTVGKAEKKRFARECMKSGFTMTGAVKWFMAQIVEGKISLPKEET